MLFRSIPGALLAVPFVAFLNTTVRALKRGPESAVETAVESADDEEEAEA